MQRFVFALDLKDDPSLIAEYEAHHRAVWPGIEKSILDSGVLRAEIFRTGNRLVLILQTDDQFSLEQKALMDAANAEVQEWEKLMWSYQQALPGATPGEKWMKMEKIYDLSAG